MLLPCWILWLPSAYIVCLCLVLVTNVRDCCRCLLYLQPVFSALTADRLSSIRETKKVFLPGSFVGFLKDALLYGSITYCMFSIGLPRCVGCFLNLRLDLSLCWCRFRLAVRLSGIFFFTCVPHYLWLCCLPCLILRFPSFYVSCCCLVLFTNIRICCRYLLFLQQAFGALSSWRRSILC